MSQIYFTSDIHIGHANIIAYSGRPFDDVPDMNAKLVEGWNQIVHPADTVYILGDLVMGKLDDSLPIAGQLQGHKILVPGNHDRLHPMYKHKKGYDQWAARYRDEAGIEHVTEPQTRLPIGHHRGVLVCHFPYTGDHTGEDDRYTEERPADGGEWLVHGHVHDAWRHNGRCINVGLDAWGGCLLTEDSLENILDGPKHLHTDRWTWDPAYPYLQEEV